RNECAVPGGYMSGSRGSASFFTGVIENRVSAYDVPEWKCRNAVIEATGSSAVSLRISAPGCDPNEVTLRQSSVVPAGSAAEVMSAGRSRVLRSAHVSAEA